MAALVAGRRLPWIKLWIEGMAHEKVALLSDAQFRSWVLVLCAGAQQPVRWRFASAQHAAVVSGRPLQHVKHLIKARLLDERDDGLWVHDYKQWQDVYESDLPLNGSGQRSAIAPSTLRDYSEDAPPNGPARTRAPAKTGEERRETRDEETGDPEENSQPGPEKQQPEGDSSAAAPSAAAEPSADLFAGAGWSPSDRELEKLRQIADQHGLDLELQALKITSWLRSPKGSKQQCTFRFVADWLNREHKNGSNGHAKTGQYPGRSGPGSRGTDAGPGAGDAGEDDPFAKYVRSDANPNGLVGSS